MASLRGGRPSASIHWVFAALSLAFALAHAQTCYYPDGLTVSTTDIPCNASSITSSCCGSDQFCLVGGLCFGGGIVSRGSCTDQTWGTTDCAQVCKTVSKSEGIAITPCTSNTGSTSVNYFVCGVNTTECNNSDDLFAIEDDLSFLLRPAQVAALLEPALAAQPAPAGMVSVGALAGVAVGIALPAIIGLAVLGILLRKEKRKGSRPKKLKLPKGYTDEKYVFAPDPHPSPYQRADDFPIPVDMAPLPTPSVVSAGEVRSRASSLRSGGSETPRLLGASFIERYGTMKQNSQISEGERHELETASHSVLRYELGDKRMS